MVSRQELTVRIQGYNKSMIAPASSANVAGRRFSREMRVRAAVDFALVILAAIWSSVGASGDTSKIWYSIIIGGTIIAVLSLVLSFFPTKNSARMAFAAFTIWSV